VLPPRDDGATLATAIRQGAAVAVSDGAYKTGKGAVAWVIDDGIIPLD
jgi:hypothetical protein